MSPSLWWNDSTTVSNYVNALMKTTKGQRLFVTSGGYEGDIDRPVVRLSQILDSLRPTQTAFGHRR